MGTTTGDARGMARIPAHRRLVAIGRVAREAVGPGMRSFGCVVREEPRFVRRPIGCVMREPAGGDVTVLGRVVREATE